jgi:hypothetical protein
MSSHTPRQALRVPKFDKEVVADHLDEAYWVDAVDFDNDGKPDLLGYGIGYGEVYWYHNPDWTRRLVNDKFHMPVGADHADISGNGYQDIAVCYQLYLAGGRIDDPDPEGGKIDWLENPGDAARTDARWRRHYVGKAPCMHRLRIGHFTRTDRLEILGLPVVGVKNVHSLVPVVLFSRPDNVQEAEAWPRTVVDDTHFRVIHEAERKPNLIPGSHLDSVVLASEEGVTWLYYDEQQRQWQRILIGRGEQTQFDQTGFKGSGNASVGRVGDDPFAYVASVEPFHGNTVAVYVKDPGGCAHPAQATWRRVVLDVYGDPNDKGEGPGHHVVCADFDGDGDDEFLVALRGPWPWQGVMYYKAIDLANGVFAKWRVSTESAARIALGHFDGGDGPPDFATIAYKVDKYHVAKDAKLMVYRNHTLAGTSPGSAHGKQEPPPGATSATTQGRTRPSDGTPESATARRTAGP